MNIRIKVSNNNVTVSIPRCSAVYKAQETAHFRSAIKEGMQSQSGNINTIDLLLTYWVHAKGAICAMKGGGGDN